MSLVNGSPDASAIGDSRFWLSRTRRVQWRINIAWWLDALQPSLFLGAVILTTLILAARRAGWSHSLLLAASSVIALAVILATTYRARRNFISFETARAELEARLALHSRLSTAAAGIGSWPARTAWDPQLWHWNWRRLGPFPAFSTLLLTGALLVPIVGAQEKRLPPNVKPAALTAVEEWLDTLAKNEAVDPESIEPIQEQANELGKKDPSEWYSHANLEAANHLQEQLKEGTRALDQNAAALQSLLGTAENLSETSAKQWNEQFGAAVEGLTGNAPTLSRALNQQLRELDASKLRSLTPEQLQQLQKRLSEARGACKECLGKFCLSESESEEGGPTGAGGISRGPGHAPLTLKSEETKLDLEKTETLQSQDLSRATLGDLAGMSLGQHEVDKQAQSENRGTQGGRVANEGAGPDVVWIQQSLKPEERQRLRQFYK